MHRGGRVLNSGVLSTLLALNILSMGRSVLKTEILYLMYKFAYLICRTYLNSFKKSLIKCLSIKLSTWN